MNEKVEDPDVLEMKRLSRESEEMVKVDFDAEIADQQRRLKETEGDPQGEEGREAARKGAFKGEDEVRSEMVVTKIKPVKEEVKQGYEKYLDWKKRQDEKECDRDPEEITDPLAFEAKMFRKRWNRIYLEVYGSFDKNTNIPCKRFTHTLAPRGGFVCSTVQVFSVKVEEISEGLKWPLEVFGMVALRDSIDLSRNIIFKRERHNCQILTAQNPCLVLTGPVRAVMAYGLVIFEASLYVKGATRSDDKELSLLATSVQPDPILKSCLFQRSYMSRLSTLKLMLGHLIGSMEATIRVRVASGTWPDGFHGRFAVRAGSIKEHIVLLDSGDSGVSLTGEEIRLARQVVSIEAHRKLVVFVAAKNGSDVHRDVHRGAVDFKPLEMGESSKELQIGSCMLEVTVYWSRFEIS